MNVDTVGLQTNVGWKYFGKNYICIEHVQTFIIIPETKKNSGYLHSIYIVLWHLFLLWETEPKALCMLSHGYTTELHSQPLSLVL